MPLSDEAPERAARGESAGGVRTVPERDAATAGDAGGSVVGSPAMEGAGLYRLLVETVRDYAIFALDPTGHVLTWNAGAQRLKGYAASEIVGRHFSTFYPPARVAEARRAGAAGVAVLRGVWDAPDPAAAIREYLDSWKEIG